MATAFQANAFQANAFQIDSGADTDLGEVSLSMEMAVSFSGGHRVLAINGNLNIGYGSGHGGMAFPLNQRLRIPRLNTKGPTTLPTSQRRALPRPTIIKPEPLASEAQLTEDRWRAWQASPDAVGKGSASILEFLVWEFLVKQKKLIEGVDFIYQYPLMGGRTQFGGFVADFYFPIRREVWNPAGLEFHWTTTRHRARDIIARAVLGSRGVKLIYLWEDDLMNRPQYTLEKAWRSEEIPKT